jgi:amino acid transporter
VPEEPRFFIRIALYASVAGTVYWFASYDERAGSLLFLFLAVATLFFAIVAAAIAHSSRDGSTPSGGPLSALDRVLGFGGVPGNEDRPPLDLEVEPVAPASTWPVFAALSLLLIGLGLIYGAWFWLPGIALAAGSAWGWTTELM